MLSRGMTTERQAQQLASSFSGCQKELDGWPLFLELGLLLPSLDLEVVLIGTEVELGLQDKHICLASAGNQG